jgi:hypothetical protein
MTKRNRDRRSGALVAGVGHHVHAGVVQGGEDAVIVGGTPVVAGAG